MEGTPGSRGSGSIAHVLLVYASLGISFPLAYPALVLARARGRVTGSHLHRVPPSNTYYIRSRFMVQRHVWYHFPPIFMNLLFLLYLASGGGGGGAGGNLGVVGKNLPARHVRFVFVKIDVS